jgi:hypothetical protein
MRKSLLSLLVVATVIATILVAGCTSSTPSSPQVASTNTSTSSTTATTTSSSSAAPSVTPSPSASASPTPTVSPTPTASPSASGKIPTSITALAGSESGPAQVIFTKGEPINWSIEVTSSATQLTVCGGSVTVSIPGHPGQVTSGGASGCYRTAYFTLSSGLPTGKYTVTLSYSGDSTHQAISHAFDITVS